MATKTKDKPKAKDKSKPEPKSMLVMSRRSPASKRDAITWANSTHGLPLMQVFGDTLYEYGFTEAEINGILPIMAHNIHLFIKHT